ncbi:hypothetical protein IGI04_006864 [Brassica rapa subsp. trilocularis]|uniref:Neprosin activation peptide domain-containing protein n=1 Tax=Brassica rapa subsp. trilocularis TaxID=1813537 RepID=A0ABQ7NKI6_BRACM|nr:hypothetical protein IGI04_006864 [Brassica rapa subsp. trilocularis]
MCGFFSLSYAARSGVSKQEFEVKKHVNSLNKPVVKSIPDGDVKDCVPTTKRPAFDHHFLKDHMIQFPKSAEPDLINQSGHQVSQSSFYFVGFFMSCVVYFFGLLAIAYMATINVWELNIQLKNELSFSQIWLPGGSSGHNLNSIEAGVMKGVIRLNRGMKT